MWSVTNEEDALSQLPENNMYPGIYKCEVKDAKLMPAKQFQDGTMGKPWLKLVLNVDTPAGKMFGEATIFDTPRMFFKRKHFWESAGHPENINADHNAYIGKHVEADFVVDTYESKLGEQKKKYVVKDFIGDSAKEKMKSESGEAFPDEELPF